MKEQFETILEFLISAKTNPDKWPPDKALAYIYCTLSSYNNWDWVKAREILNQARQE